MFYVNKGYTLKFGGVAFTAGKRLPDNRDYSALIRLGMVSQTLPKPAPKPGDYEPSIVKIQRDKRNKIKKEQGKAKAKRAKDKKDAKAKAEKDKAEQAKGKKKVFTVETGG